MNSIIKQLNTRKSIREFTGESVSEEDLQTIFHTAQRCPTSINAQQISLVYTRDKDIIKQIAQISGGQKQVESADVFVCIVIDFVRADEAAKILGKEIHIQQSAEGILIGAVDGGIMLSALQTAAESLGYGTTAIGGIRNNSQAMIELLNLPANTFPLVGTTIGVPTKEAKDAPLKPRVPLESFVMQDVYDEEAVRKGVPEYEKEFKSFREKHNMNYMTSYIERTANDYANKRRIVARYFESQGFFFKDPTK